MARLRYNGLSTTLGGSLTNVATSVTFAAALTHSNGTNVPTIVAPDYIPLAILGATGHLSEIVYLTAYTAAGTTGTITRGVEGTTAVVHSSGDTVTGAALVADSSIFSGFYGDGSDGNVTISTTITLTRDMVYDTLTVASGGILKPNGFRVYAKTALVVASGGVISYNGNAASGSTAGTTGVNASGTMTGGGTAGATGVTGAGAQPASTSQSIGGSGGGGGTGTGGAVANSRAVVAPGSNLGSVRTLPAAATGLFPAGQVLFSGGGGSSGVGDGTNAGGGGGAGGGILIFNARAVTNSGTISADGGAGGNSAAGNTGGGGGGGGGVVIVNTATALTGTNPTAAGGAGGTKQGTGTNGSAGSSGSVLVNVWI